MDGFVSIFENWTKQCYGRLYDSTGAQCALGWALGNGSTYGSATEVRLLAIGRYIQKHYPLPEECQHVVTNSRHHPITDAISAVIYANNELRLTPEQFRQIDIVCQVEAIVKPLIDSAVVQEEQCV